jgi:hypothetical protein
MNISAWRKVAAVGLGTALLAAGCVVSSGDDNGTGGTSGTSGSGGSTAGKGGSGGSTGGTGGTTGGTAGTGGSTGGTGGSTGGTAGTGGGDAGPCTTSCCVCMEANCATEYNACTGTCARELVCIQECVLGAVAEGGVADSTTFGTCANSCAEGSTITPETNDAFSCMNSGQRADGGTSAGCLTDCLSG